jgi:hypothetical protein
MMQLKFALSHIADERCKCGSNHHMGAVQAVANFVAQGARAIDTLIDSGEAVWCAHECGTLLIDGEGTAVIFEDDEAGTLCDRCYESAPKAATQ